MNKKLDTIIYILGLVVVGLLLVGIVNVFASDPYGEVKDNNNGNAGYILVSTGQNQGSQSIGHWTDVNDIPNLKGDKGDKGDTGLQGIQGLTGLQGIAGLNGIQGIAGLNGIDGIDGINGINGLDGLNGKDVDPATVNRLDDKNREQDKRIDNLDKRVSRLEETKYLFETVLRLTDTAKTRIEIFDSYDVRHSQNFAIGVRFTYKMGKSYEEKMIEKTNKRIDKIEARLGVMPILEKVVDEKGNVKSISISDNGASLSGKF